MSDDLVTIATFLNIGEAKLAQGKLSSAGVAASVRDENAMNLHIGMAMWGIKLQVPDRQVVRAWKFSTTFALRRTTTWKATPTRMLCVAVQNVSRSRFEGSRRPAQDKFRYGRQPFHFLNLLRRRNNIGVAWPAGISGKRKQINTSRFATER